MLTRREFLKLCLSSAALSLSGILLPKVAEALGDRGEKATVIWLELMTCTGDFMSFANTLSPDVEQLIRDTIKLEYQNTLMTAEGETALKHLYETASKQEGKYILVVEGTVPTKDNGIYGKIGYFEDGRPVTDLDAVKYFGTRAKYVIAIGTCASFGGPYAASPNPSGSLPVDKILKDVQVINTPGCPCHPDWFVGTLSHAILYGVPELDAFGRPIMFYRHSIHDFCPKRQHFENSIFAKFPGDYGCLFEIGCKGPVTFVDCPTRMWNSAHINWPVKANTHCIGCVSPEFPDGMSPFFAHLPDVDLPGINASSSLVGKVAVGGALMGVAGHAAVSLLKGRIQNHLVNGSQTRHVDEKTLSMLQEEEKTTAEALKASGAASIKDAAGKSKESADDSGVKAHYGEKSRKRPDSGKRMDADASDELSPREVSVVKPKKIRIIKKISSKEKD
ncbi:MAG: hydrogenase small subunit [Tepidanaerobacteraceae bacterium]|jgi:hydrogenase small subunit|nr:hydrogenase small subunit [Tepidanaerobacteraceae bacterium]